MTPPDRQTAAHRLGAALVAALMAVAAAAGLGAWGLVRADAALRGVHADGRDAMKTLSAVALFAARDRVLLADAVLQAQAETTAERLRQYRDHRERSVRAWQHYLAHAVAAEVRPAAAEADRTLMALVSAGFEPTAASLAAGDHAEAKRRLDDDIGPAAGAFAAAMARLEVQQTRTTDLARSAAEAQIHRVRLALAAVTAASIAACALLALDLGRRAARGDATPA